MSHQEHIAKPLSVEQVFMLLVPSMHLKLATTWSNIANHPYLTEEKSYGCETSQQIVDLIKHAKKLF